VKTREFIVCLDEIQQNFVFGDQFAGSYTKTLTMSDGSTRTIKLTPMIHDGRPVVELNDTGHISYMGLNGTTTNGTLMVQLCDIEEMRRQLEDQDDGVRYGIEAADQQVDQIVGEAARSQIDESGKPGDARRIGIPA
jgi:hypothetical protein